MTALLELESVSLSYGSGGDRGIALRDVSLELRPGEILAVQGKARAGKTSLARVAAGLLPADSGRVIFRGRDFAACSSGELARLQRREIGWVQTHGPECDHSPMDVYVALGLYRDMSAKWARSRAATALARVGVSECAHLRWGELTGGERVLVAIAKALAHEPKLLVLDNPTGALGEVERDRIARLLHGMAEEGGVGILMAVADVPAALPAHGVRLLRRGRLLRPSDLRSGHGGNVIRFPHDDGAA